MAETDVIDDVLGRMRTGTITPSTALQELRSARKTDQITDSKRYRAALTKVYDRMPIWLEGPAPPEVSNRAPVSREA